jgi:photoactive yellow protein
VDTVGFDKDGIEKALCNPEDNGINDLAFGAIQVDEKGTILQYNAAEGAITGRNPEEVIGKNFFTEVAPCTNIPEFRGRFEEGIATGTLSTLFEYVFDYEMSPTKVKVQMMNSLLGEDNYWVFVKRL